MSDSVFWLIISICMAILGIMFMLFGWGTSEFGGWFCVLGLFVILTGAILAGATAEAKEGDDDNEE